MCSRARSSPAVRQDDELSRDDVRRDDVCRARSNVGCQQESDCGADARASVHFGHPLDDYAAVLKKLRVQPWARFARAVKAGADGRGHLRRDHDSARAARANRKWSRSSAVPPDPAGRFRGGRSFGRSAPRHRDLLEPGDAVCCSCRPKCRAIEYAHVRRRSRSMMPRPAEGTARLPARRRAARGPGEASGSGAAVGQSRWRRRGERRSAARTSAEVGVKLPGRFKVSADHQDVEAVPGVVQVES